MYSGYGACNLLAGCATDLPFTPAEAAAEGRRGRCSPCRPEAARPCHSSHLLALAPRYSRIHATPSLSKKYSPWWVTTRGADFTGTRTMLTRLPEGILGPFFLKAEMGIIGNWCVPRGLFLLGKT